MWRFVLVFITGCSARPAPAPSPITAKSVDTNIEAPQSQNQWGDPRPQSQWEPDAAYCFDLCSTEGRCDYKDGECVANDMGCFVVSRGRGEWVAKDGRCVDISDCSEECAEKGDCVMYYGDCQPLSDDDCAESKICKKEGACKMLRVKAEEPLDEYNYCGH